MKIVDISGFGHSGKTIICDLIKEFNGFHVCDHNFEFNLLRIQDGLIDLKKSLLDNWSPIRSDSAVKRFKNLIIRVGPKAKFSNPKSLFYSNGMNYDSFFNNKFSQISLNYINSLIDYEYYGEWPYSSLEKNPFNQFLIRLLNQFGISNHRKEKISISSGKNFLLKTRNYLDKLFSEMPNTNLKNIVINNAFEPFDPYGSILFFNNAKSIIVHRDPRDIYCSTLKSFESQIFIPDYDKSTYHKDLKRDFLNTNDLELFIERQKIYFSKVNLNSSERVLRISFEETVMDYENQLKKIYDFLEIDSTSHDQKFKFFDPKLSAKNIGLWKNYEKVEEINLIHNELKEYCYK